MMHEGRYCTEDKQPGSEQDPVTFIHSNVFTQLS